MKNIDSWNEAVEHCRKILEKFRPKHKRIRVFIGFEIKPIVWSDCPHAETPEQALNMIKEQNAIQKELRLKE